MKMTVDSISDAPGELPAMVCHRNMEYGDYIIYRSIKYTEIIKMLLCFIVYVEQSVNLSPECNSFYTQIYENKTNHPMPINTKIVIIKSMLFIHCR